MMHEVKTSEKTLTYSYNFTFENGDERKYIINIEPESLQLIRVTKQMSPEWTELRNFKCPHCPLDEEEHKFCPVAQNLEDIIAFFSDTSSYDHVKINVKTNEREYHKKTSVQVGVGSIIGIIMPTSGCPIMGKLKPLVRFHLPFASIQETEFRVFSMYLLAQYLKMRKGENPDWSLNNLKQLYTDIQKLNSNVAQKIADLESKDASINAVVVLNNFADSVSFCLDEDDLSDFEFLFREFIS